jgi:hypothetical protein
MLRCTYQIRPATGSSTELSCSEALRKLRFPGEATILNFKLDPSASSGTGIADQLAKDSGPLDSSFAPIGQEV